MVGQFRLQRSLQDCFRELFQKAVLADDVFRLLVICQQLINECLVDGHRFPFSSSDGRLHSPFYTLHTFSDARTRCTMHNCTSVCGYSASMASGNPFSPSTQAMKISFTPRFFSSVSTKENDAECSWVCAETQVEPISSET